MKISLYYVGKTNQKFVKEGFDVYKKRIVHYTNFEVICVEDVKAHKNMSSKQLKELEGKKILKKINKTDFVILLDELGKNYTSVKFAEWIEKKMVHGTKHLVFIIGGAFGFSDVLYQRADFKLRLSDMTFSHQIIRVLFAEQLYRAHTIIKGESYHNS